MRIAASCVLVSVALVSVGCAKDQCERIESKLRSCDLLTAGKFNCTESPLAEADCFVDCYTSASCDAIRTVVCSETEVDSLQSCQAACVRKYGFKCEEGTEVVLSAERCDGNRDCEDGSDEDGCPTFACADGSTVDVDDKCNGISDCNDGSDEEGCPGFSCKDGSKTIPEDDRCDGHSSCGDGSDEDGCPTFACSDGSKDVPERYRCDGSDDCSDGSDEEGCPTFAHMNCSSDD